MPYFEGLNIIYSHIPKAAGESVVETLRTYSVENKLGSVYVNRKHETMLDIKAYMQRGVGAPDAFTKSFKFATVRNPWDRAFSWYNYMRFMWGEMPEGFPPEATTFCDKVPLCEYNCRDRLLESNFNTWISELTRCGTDGACKSTVCPYHIIADQYLFVVDNGGNFMIDDYLRFEHLEEWQNWLTCRMDNPPSLCFKNKGSYSGSFREHYSDESIFKIAEIYKHDIEFFDYNFDG